MRNEPPEMSWQERIKRNNEKERAVLNLLASGEVFSSLAVISCLLGVSLPNARRCVSGLEKKSCLLRERHYINGRSTDIFGITQHGLVVAHADPKMPPFEAGRVKSQFITHRLECQRVRIVCERLGGKFFPELMLRNRGLKKIPDGLWYSEHYGKICIEVEREAKSRKRLEQIFQQYLVLMEGDEAVDLVLYLVPKNMFCGMYKLLQSTPLPRPPSRDGLPLKRPARFAIGNLEKFPQSVQYLHQDYFMDFETGIDRDLLE